MKPAPMTELSPELVETIAKVLKQYAAAFYIDCGTCGDGLLENAAEKLAEHVAKALNASTLADENAMLRECLEEARLIVANLPHDESLFLAKIDTALSHKETNR